jgi:hypothetical protein
MAIEEQQQQSKQSAYCHKEIQKVCRIRKGVKTIRIRQIRKKYFIVEKCKLMMMKTMIMMMMLMMMMMMKWINPDGGTASLRNGGLQRHSHTCFPR